jgi:hypothetical protein
LKYLASAGSAVQGQEASDYVAQHGRMPVGLTRKSCLAPDLAEQVISLTVEMSILAVISIPVESLEAVERI